MSVIRKRGDYQYQAIVRKKGYPPQSKTFATLREAQAWSSTIESEMHRSVFVSRAKAEATTLRALIAMYQEKVTPRHKGADSEQVRLAMLGRLPLSERFVATLRSEDFARYRDARLKTRKPATVTDAQRQTERDHPLRSWAMLRELGVNDALWLRLVEEQHERPDGSGYPAGKPVADLAQRLLQMADAYVACISPRQGRGGLLSQQVARELYHGPNQQPDALGALFIKHMGFYPPGSYVRLASGEVAVVTRRGAKANAPQVFAIVGRQGMPLGEPTWRDTQDPTHEIRASLPPGDVRVVVNVPRLLSRR